MSKAAPSGRRHRFPHGIVAHTVWLYLRCSLSLRAVGDLLVERGVDVLYKTLCRLVVKFGPAISRSLRSRQARPGRIWRLDEVQVSIRGLRFWLWREVGETGLVLEELLQPRRDRKAAKRLLRYLFMRAGRPPKRIVTNKPASYAAGSHEIAPGLEHRAYKGLNNRSENGHQPFRPHGKAMRGHRSPGRLRRFVSMRSAVRNRIAPLTGPHCAQITRYHHLKAFGVRCEAASFVA